ncbi:hypothetical protein UA08_08699 [Talaromyces atroroseus]|uniref:BIR-domain-containing protein n=1 Tax=Talaromyces atroroseus TaxID=1441469 RepID=A0A225A8A1_TALAT|nr:hypothetical protein UA08_08699 [Talaromyces atroroseus]OKL56120.1 hypothetical protein UA08_08699 [Talaromyces atroroseus]
MDIQQKTSNPAEIEDPTSMAIVEARRTTFAIGWPHDGKSGWVCQSDKMVEAGWYFCPNEESPDLASCPYCKLSLDGWEETDNPFEEHYRRSSDCSFFVFALPAAKPTKKATRAKKPRASKTSRLSTQSVMITTSEAPTHEDDTMDISVTSQATTKKSKGTKKTPRSRAKKGKKEEPLELDELVEPEQAEEKEPEPERPKRATRGTKRGSEAVAQDLPLVTSTEVHITPDPEEPSPKRRATEIRRSLSQPHEDVRPDYPDEAPVDVATSPVMPKKGRKGTKKSTATKTRKISSASASGRTTNSKIPDDSILEAAIEADLARNRQESEPFEFHYKDEERESARFRKQSISASTEVVPVTQYDIEDAQDTRAKIQATYREHVPDPEPEPEPIHEATAEPKAKKSSKRKAPTKKSKKEKAATPTEPEPEPELVESMHSEPDLPAELDVSQPQSIEEEELVRRETEVEPHARQGSLVAVEIEINKRQPESDTESTQPPMKKQGRKTASKGKKPAASKRIDDDIAFNEEQNEASDTNSHNALLDAAKTRGSSSKRKSKEANKAVVVIDQQNAAPEGSAHEAAVEQPQVKAKRGRPAKDAERKSQENPNNNNNNNQVVEAKPKRGRPSKQIPRDEDQDEQETEEQSKQSRRSPKSKLPPKNTRRYSDLPKDRHRAQSFIESVAQESSSPQTRAPDTTHSRTQERTPSPSPQSSDAENKPPSTRPRSARPPIVSPSKTLSTRVPLAASTPVKSPSKRQVGTGYLSSSHSWQPMDIDELLGSLDDKENRDFTINQSSLKDILTSPEKKMTVEEWIQFNAKNGEERLRQECERLISIFEREGGRAMRALEGIECID